MIRPVAALNLELQNGSTSTNKPRTLRTECDRSRIRVNFAIGRWSTRPAVFLDALSLHYVTVTSTTWPVTAARRSYADMHLS